MTQEDEIKNFLEGLKVKNMDVHNFRENYDKVHQSRMIMQTKINEEIAKLRKLMDNQEMMEASFKAKHADMPEYLKGYVENLKAQIDSLIDIKDWSAVTKDILFITAMKAADIIETVKGLSLSKEIVEAQKDINKQFGTDIKSMFEKGMDRQSTFFEKQITAVADMKKDAKEIDDKLLAILNRMVDSAVIGKEEFKNLKDIIKGREPAIESEKTIRKFACPKCDDEFPTKDDWLKHREKHRAEKRGEAEGAE